MALEKYQKVIDAIPENEWLFPSQIKRIAIEEVGLSKDEAKSCWKSISAKQHTFYKRLERKRLGSGGKTFLYRKKPK